MNRDKLILIKSDADNSWSALYSGEEAHNIEGATHEERLGNAANIWGVSVDCYDTDRIDYEIWS